MDITKHKTNLTNILIDIYKDSYLAGKMGFKGGTAAMLFYNLPRFSVDLDFDYIGEKPKINETIAKITEIVSKKYRIKDQSTKFNTLFWLLSYEKGEHNIKLEISTRDNSYNNYQTKVFYGVGIKVIDISDMIAHKMVAFSERPSLANRDLFDIHYLLGTEYAWNINYEVIKKRTGKNPVEFYKLVLNLVETVKPDKILEGLGEVLTDSQKNWAKAKLLIEVKNLVQRQMDLIEAE